MSVSKLVQGHHGEEFAVSFLRHLGWQIIERNFRIRGGEIDIIAIETDPTNEEKTLVFVEVKTRSSADFGEPLEAIGYYKIRALTRATQFYKLKHPHLPDLMRIDAVSVIVNESGQLLDIELVKNISF
ncbi:MAG TPA: YraN family protein [Candidatus Saccharimonadales bacterium]|nr:YraN family protein [Candidatus Saccharimonadales bacterium]